MNIDNNYLQEIYKKSEILKIKCIKEEIEDCLNGFKLKNIELENSRFNCLFTSDQGDEIILSISNDQIILTKNTKYKYERISIFKNLISFIKVIEKRPNGLIYSDIKKLYQKSERFNGEVFLTDLIENRYVITNEKIKELPKPFDYQEDNFLKILFKLISSSKENLENYANLTTKFSSHMNYYLNLECDRLNLGNNRKAKVGPYSNLTYLNEENVSYLYDIVDGHDKIKRIYDLYNGIINTSNEWDIHSIHLGLLSHEGFNLKELKGITKTEDELVGTSYSDIQESYIKYLKNYLKNMYGIEDEIDFSREAILRELLINKNSLNQEETEETILENEPKKFLKKIFEVFGKK